MKRFLLAIILVCSFSAITATSQFLKNEECKATNLKADYYYDIFQIVVTFNSPQDCNLIRFVIKCSINGQIHHINTVDENTAVGVIQLIEHLSCKDDVEVSVVSYGEDDVELGESDVVEVVIKPCKECEAEITGIEYDGRSQLILSIIPPQSICDEAASIKLKSYIDDDTTIHGNIYIEDTVGIISLSEPLSCESDIKVTIETYDVNDLIVVESHMKKLLRCDPCKASINGVAYDGNLNIFVSITSSGSDCLATTLRVKCKIDGEIIYGDTIVDNIAGIISLSEKLLCENNVVVSIVVYGKNDLELWESNAIKVRIFDC
ncbi:uncharacterized protein [Onthophagus taurus]|uniref:uncharacterized protein n=1 Tax=Onthophagus taurus TaxID=166361 RepID=UPI0039BE6E81